MGERDFKGVWVPKEIWLTEDIGWTAKLLLVEIDSLAINGECFAGNTHFAQFFGLSKDRITRLISELKEKGYIEVRMVYKPGTKQIDKRLISTRGYRQKCLQGIGENAYTPLGENTDTPIGENTEDNNTVVINTEVINTREKKGVAPPVVADYSETNFSDPMKARIEEWLQYKTERKEKYTPTGLSSLITQLQTNVNKYGEDAVMELISTCMSSGWKGIIFDRLKNQPTKKIIAPSPSWGGRDKTPAQQAAMQSDVDDLEKLLASVGVRV